LLRVILPRDERMGQVAESQHKEKYVGLNPLSTTAAPANDRVASAGKAVRCTQSARRSGSSHPARLALTSAFARGAWLPGGGWSFGWLRICPVARRVSVPPRAFGRLQRRSSP